MTMSKGNAFDTLLSTWLEHQELREAGASVNELYSSRVRLDSARLAAITTR